MSIKSSNQPDGSPCTVGGFFKHMEFPVPTQVRGLRDGEPEEGEGVEAGEADEQAHPQAQPQPDSARVGPGMKNSLYYEIHIETVLNFLREVKLC